MLKVPYRKLRPNSKGGLNNKHNKCSYQHKLQYVGKRIVQGIPVLSIFALVGIVSVSLTATSDLTNNLTSSSSLLSAVFSNTDTNKAYAAETITASSSDGNSTISFTIAGADKAEQVSAGRGETVYRAHTITLNASNIESYALTISGNPNMTNPSGSTTSDTITATNGSSNGTNLASNTWGYYYGEYNTTNGNNKESVVYKPLVSTGTTIDTGKPTNYTITNQTKNLVFAAKFGEDIAQGRYYANVNLSVTATPKALIEYQIIYDYSYDQIIQKAKSHNESYQFTIWDFGECSESSGDIACAGPTLTADEAFLGWSTDSNATEANSNYAPGKTITLTASNPTLTLYPVVKTVTSWWTMTKMQEMTPEACASTPIGSTTVTTRTLTDSRDGKSYTVAKLNDGNCWMMSNLAFDITQATNTMSSENSDVADGWSWPTTPTRYTTGTGWASNDTAVAYITNPAVNSSNPGDGSGYQVNYGYYYSWCAATAGCRSSANSNPGNNVDAASSICPRGWHLPKGGTVNAPNTSVSQNGNDFVNIFGYAGAVTNATNIYGTVNASFSNRALSANGSTWAAAGYLSPSNGLTVPGVDGLYWSRTSYGTAYGYYLRFSSGNLLPASTNMNRRGGLSVRCVAYSS